MPKQPISTDDAKRTVVMPDWAKAASRRNSSSPNAAAPAPQAPSAIGEEKKPATASQEKKIAWPVVAKKIEAAVDEKKSAVVVVANVEPAAAGLEPCVACGGGLVFWRPRVRKFNFDWRCACCDVPGDPGAVAGVVVVEVDLFGGESVARRVSVPVDLVGGLFFVDDLDERWAGFWRAVAADGVEVCERVVVATIAAK